MSRGVLLLAGGVLALSGCVTVKPVALPDGKAGYSLSGCGDLAQCMNLAAKHCGGPYTVIGSQNHHVVVEGYGGSSTELVFSCGEATPATNAKP